jgi:site-specific DNA-methyltransferase (adenine-specific)
MTDIRIGDCLQVMPSLPENSIDSIITDPPYGLDFMGKSWDHGVPGVEFWQAALRVAKPGAILMAFGGTRTWHRLACAIEDAGWELRDTMMWLYGSGFPKSLDISKAIDKAAGAEREVVGHKTCGYQVSISKARVAQGYRPNETCATTDVNITAPATNEAKLWSGYGTALKPAWEPIIVAMKPLEGTYAENAQKWGVAGLNIDGSKIGVGDVITHGGGRQSTENWRMTKEVGTTHQGRWPANLLLDEESARLLDEQSGVSKSTGIINRWKDGAKPFGGGAGHPYESVRGVADSGGASRFFYTAKASSSERNAGLEDSEAKRDADRVRDDGIGGDNPRNRSNTPKLNFHPTVKPVDLMRYLCKLTRTPTGGVVLDPFMGSGTTGIACVLEHRDFIGIEISPEYAAIADKRIADAVGPLFQEAA